MFPEEADVVGQRRGPIGPTVAGFRWYLEERGYSDSTVISRTRIAAHVVRWLEGSNRAVGTLTGGDPESFGCHLLTCRCFGAKAIWRKDAVVGARLFLDYLRRQSLVAPAPSRHKAPGSLPLIQGFTHWMHQHRGTSAKTLDQYGRVLDDLVRSVGEDPAQFHAAALRRFVLERGQQHGRGQAKSIAVAVRVFLRYLIATGQCQVALRDAIPPVAQWRRSSLPRYLPASDVDRILVSCPAETPLGLRDRAILLLLCRLGLRAQEVASIRLGDFDWQDASLIISGKGGRRDRLPLTQEVGDAILSYLEHGRPPFDGDSLFLRARAPRRPFTGSSAVSTLAGRAIRRAQVNAPTYGAHVFRHSAATEMLRQGSSLEAIAQVLRHRCLETTAQYAKVDLALLREVTQPWPEVISC